MGGARTFNALRGACAPTGAITKDHRITVLKSDDDKRLVFGWASVAVRVTGEEIADWQEDIVA